MVPQRATNDQPMINQWAQGPRAGESATAGSGRAWLPSMGRQAHRRTPQLDPRARARVGEPSAPRAVARARGVTADQRDGRQPIGPATLDGETGRHGRR